MTHKLPPLPVKLRVPGRDVIDAGSVESVSYKLEGRVYFEDDMLTLEWAGTRTVETVGFMNVETDVSQSPLGSVDVSLDEIRGARMRGGWWWPRLELRSDHLDTFDGVPGAKPGRLVLGVKHRDRALGQEFALAITRAIERDRLGAPIGEALEAGESTPTPD